MLRTVPAMLQSRRMRIGSALNPIFRRRKTEEMLSDRDSRY
jgi:hypothetical protein